MSDFFVGEFIFEPCFGALSGFFGLSFVNLVGLNRQVGEDRDAGGRDFDESSAGREEAVTAILSDDDFPRHHLCNKGDVLWVHPELAGYARQCDHFHYLGVHRALGGDDFKF